MTSDFNDEKAPQRQLVQDAARVADVTTKHRRVGELLQQTQADALLLQAPANVAWVTSGADLNRCASEDCAASVFITRDARLFATNAVDSAQLFEREAFGLGFQLKQREWFQPHSELVADLCRGRKVLSDSTVEGTDYEPDRIRTMRLPLTELDVERLQLLSQVAVHAVEATAHHVQPGATEAEVAGEVHHRLVKRTVTPVRVQVCADGRNERYRHWTYGEHAIDRYAAISCIARRWGLHVGVTRTVCFGSVPDHLSVAYRNALLIHATGLFFSRHEQSLQDIWKKAHRIYEKFGMENEWQLADQASVMGYQINEAQLTPHNQYVIEAPTPMFWHPSVGPAMVGDTVLCGANSNEQMTQSASWPHVSVLVKGQDVTCPGILVKGFPETGNESEATQSLDLNASASDYACLDHPEDGLEPGPVDSIWEMELPSAMQT